MRKVKVMSILIIFLLMGEVHTVGAIELNVYKEKIFAVTEEVALKFDYYDEVSPSTPNYHKGHSEIGGQCGDYALAFVNLWNARYPQKAQLVIQQQGLRHFPDGIYEVIGKDAQELPFLKNRSTSMLYVWNNVLGIGHPELGGYKIKLIKRVYVKSHHGIRNWNKNGPHVWVKIDNVSIDPTYADLGTLPIIGYDTY